MKLTNNQLKEMSNRIKERRRQLGYTQEQFAEIISISASSYTKIENAFQRPSLETLILISERLQLSLDYIVFGGNKPQKDIEGEILQAAIDFADRQKLLHARDVLNKLLKIKPSYENKI